MSESRTFSLLRGVLKTLGLSATATDEVVRVINGFLRSEDEPQELLVPTEPLPYHQRDDFLTPAERSFYLVLNQAVSDWALICPKVSLGDLFLAKAGEWSANQAYNNRISRKHVDFLLCDRQTAHPLLGLELDDKSHQRPDRQDRDRFVERVFAAAALPLARVPVQHSYSTDQLARTLRQQAGLETATSPQRPSIPVVRNQQVVPPVKTATVPTCPKCGSPMTRRTAKKGQNQGNEFWGCSAYPKCRGIVTIAA